MKHLKIYENFKINESLTINDVRKNFTELTFDANRVRKNIKIEEVTDYNFDYRGYLILFLKLEQNNYMSSNIKIVIGDDMNYVFMYGSDGKHIEGDILLNTKSWLFSLKSYLPKK